LLTFGLNGHILRCAQEMLELEASLLQTLAEESSCDGVTDLGGCEVGESREDGELPQPRNLFCCADDSGEASVDRHPGTLFSRRTKGGAVCPPVLLQYLREEAADNLSSCSFSSISAPSSTCGEQVFMDEADFCSKDAQAVEAKAREAMATLEDMQRRSQVPSFR